MIDIQCKEDCCGCGACVNICPRGCIAMRRDSEGFSYPRVDEALCIQCGLCERVCPFLNPDKSRMPMGVYAAKNPSDEVRLASSSGGIFSMLAGHIIEQGGVVFGAKFDDTWNVVHDYAETKEGLRPFMGSKYVQSATGESYSLAAKFLKENRQVLFSGTPCQIAGLKRYLGADYPNLLTVDVICHGVPSPVVWERYLAETSRSLSAGTASELKIGAISFRDKANGWKNFSFVIRGENNSVLLSESGITENIYMRGFLRDIYLRPSCYACQCKKGSSGSDITLGDYWGIDRVNPEINDWKGVSLILGYTQKGLDMTHGLDAKLISTSYAQALAGNASIEKSAKPPRQRERFFSAMNNGGTISKIIERYSRPGRLQSIKILVTGSLKRILKHTGLLPLAKRVKQKLKP